MPHTTKNFTFYSSTPFDINQRNVAMGSVAGGGVGITGLTTFLNRFKVFDYNLNEDNFRIEDGVVVVPCGVASVNVMSILNAINYMRIVITPRASGYKGFPYYAFVENVELLDTDVATQAGATTGGVGAIAIHFKIDAWTTFVTCGQTPQQTRIVGGTLTRFSNEIPVNILTGSYDLYPRKLPIEPITKDTMYDTVSVNPVTVDDTLPAAPWEINMPRNMTPWAWGWGGNFPPNSTYNVRSSWRVVVSLVATDGSTMLFASAPAGGYLQLLKIASIVDGAEYFTPAPLTLDWFKSTIKNVYILPKDAVTIIDDWNSAVIINTEEETPSQEELFYHVYYQVKPNTNTLTQLIETDGADKVYTVGTPFHRVSVDQLNRENERVTAVATFKAGVSTLRISLNVGAEDIDITQDFEFLTSKDLSNKYWQENKSAIALQSLSTLATLGVGLATLNPVAIGGGLLSGAQQGVNVSRGLKQAPQSSNGGYVDISFLYGGIYTQVHDAINADAVNDAIKTEGIEVYKNIPRAWDITTTAISSIINAGVKSFFIQVKGAEVRGIPRIYAREIEEILETGVHVFVVAAKFDSKDYNND